MMHRCFRPRRDRPNECAKAHDGERLCQGCPHSPYTRKGVDTSSCPLADYVRSGAVSLVTGSREIPSRARVTRARV